MSFKIQFEDDVVPADVIKAVMDEIESLILQGCVIETDIVYHDMGEMTEGAYNYIITSGTDESGIDTLFVQSYDPVRDTITERPNE